MIVNQSNLAGLNVSYSTAFQKGMDAVEPIYPLYATEVPSSTAETNYKWLGQMPGMREWVGEREIQNLSAYEYSIRNRKFERTMSVPRDDIEDDQYGVYTPMFEMMGRIAAEHPDDLCMEALKGGFTGKCYDKKPFFAKDHKAGGRTYSNCTDLKLSVTSYVQARTAIMSIRGDKGKSLGLVPDLLMVSPADEGKAREILEADRIDGSTNVWKGTAKLQVVPALAGEKGESPWFLLCTNRPLKPIIFQKRKEIKIVARTDEASDNVFLRDEYEWGADGRSNAGYGFWQMAYGSAGTKETQG